MTTKLSIKVPRELFLWSMGDSDLGDEALHEDWPWGDSTALALQVPELRYALAFMVALHSHLEDYEAHEPYLTARNLAWNARPQKGTGSELILIFPNLELTTEES